MSTTLHLPVEGELPSLDSANQWLNSPPLSPSTLRGSAVLVEFWTFTCINWIRTLPYVRAWNERFRPSGLVVIGVHTPEFAVEHDVAAVRRAAEAMRVDFPIAIDNDYAIWDGFGNQYWPAMYFVDTQGRIRHHHFGEGDYDRSESVIRELLSEIGTNGIDPAPVSVDPRGVEAAADWEDLDSSETYLGYRRTEGFALPGGLVAGERRSYSPPATLRLNQWSLGGEWTEEAEAVLLHEAGGRIALRFHARDLHLVMTPDGHPVRFRVLLDGEPPGAAHGIDAGEQGYGTVTEPRLYQLIRQRDPIADRTFEITLLDPGLRAHVFTFG